MDRRFAAPGEEVASLVQQAPDPVGTVPESQIQDQSAWDQYLALPDRNRIGIGCSGGGIRSASYCLGALQVLRKRGLLTAATHMACVSGGGYITIGHTALVSESLRLGSDLHPPADELELFVRLPPWAPLSPEERHLRDHSTYLAPGLQGKVWLGLNLIYGLIRHLVPFAAVVYLAGALAGIALGPWIGPSLRDSAATPVPHASVSFYVPAMLVAGVGVVAGIFLLLRQYLQNRAKPSGGTLNAFQSMITFLFGLQVGVAAFLIGLPALMLLLHEHHLDWISRSPLVTGGTLTGGGLGLSLISGLLARRELSGLKDRLARMAIPLLTALAGPLVLLVPFIGVAYWNAIHVNQFAWLPLGFAFGALALFVLSWFFDEITPNMHLFYRERLSTAFIGYRKAARDGQALASEQPRWQDPIWLSKTRRGKGPAKLPNLVVCAAVAASKDVPPGRLAGSFTFESDYSGSPLTGYVETKRLEELARGSVLTLPAMMAISGAALSPSMGKLTRPALRMLMALFNVRLGVWLPNPLKHEPILAYQVGERRVQPGGSVPPAEAPDGEGEGGPQPKPSLLDRAKGAVAAAGRRFKGPGTLYLFRELLGLNDLRKEYVYVTDGGHWDNLGLVELLRRGCGQVVCFDAAGGSLGQFWTLSEAIGLARTELGVEITIKLDDLEPRDGVSKSDHAVGTIVYPDGTEGVLVFARAAMPEDAPQDAKAYREKNPRFPNDPTSDQLFNDLKFESYRSLGSHAARGVVRSLNEWRKKARLKQFT